MAEAVIEHGRSLRSPDSMGPETVDPPGPLAPSFRKHTSVVFALTGACHPTGRRMGLRALLARADRPARASALSQWPI
jgi:hypothetical protein